MAWRAGRLAGIICTLLAAASGSARAQDESGRPTEAEEPTAKPPSYPNTTAGEFTPGAGFDLVKTEFGSLNISVYGLARFLDQLPADQTFTDHLGRMHVVPTRRDINWHRTFAWLSGYFWRPALRYAISIWSLPTTQQTLVFGNLRYRFGRALEIATGIAPNLGSRSMQGPWPFFLGTDRQMADEFFRPGFTSSVWVTGEPIERFFYNVSLGNNISQLGVPSSKDTRNLSTSASLWWMPTTGEFGPRGGFGDFEAHDRVATRFGVSATRSREDRYSQIDAAPNNTQIRISDGLLLFESDALADGVTVQKATYALLAFDAGVKWRGFHLQTEYYLRRLSDFIATGALPLTSIFDHGFYVQASQMVIEKKLALYGVGSFVFDEFRRRPWEASGGINYFPSATRSFRLNLHFIYVDRSPAGSQFGYYLGGLTGPTVSVSTDFLL